MTHDEFLDFVGPFEKFAVDAVKEEGHTVHTYHVVGSTYIENSKEAADIDVLVLVSEVSDIDCMDFYGWEYGGSVGEGKESYWGSWKKLFNGRNVNLLVVNDKKYYVKWREAAEVCRLMHMVGVKEEASIRKAIHNVIMDDSDANTEYEGIVNELLMQQRIKAL